MQPFNHPLLIAIKKIAPALAAGNSVIVKPSELTPISVLEFAEIAQEAGCKFVCEVRFAVKTLKSLHLVPKGVLSILPGYGRIIGTEIISDPIIRKVDITVRNSQ